MTQYLPKTCIQVKSWELLKKMLELLTSWYTIVENPFQVAHKVVVVYWVLLGALDVFVIKKLVIPHLEVGEFISPNIGVGTMPIITEEICYNMHILLPMKLDIILVCGMIIVHGMQK